MLGFRAVGKSSLCLQYVDNTFSEVYEPTIDSTFTKPTKFCGHDYIITIYDTEGQDEYSLFSRYDSIHAHGYILVYAVTSRKSFEVIKVIFEKLVNMTGGVDVPIMLVGNKKDLEEERIISKEEGQELAKKWKAAFIETSAKNNLSVTDIFNESILEVKRYDQRADLENVRESCVLS